MSQIRKIRQFFRQLRRKNRNIYVLCQGTAILVGLLLFFVGLFHVTKAGCFNGMGMHLDPQEEDDWKPVRECRNGTRMFRHKSNGTFCIREKSEELQTTLDEDGELEIYPVEEWGNVFCDHQEAVKKACETGDYSK